MTINIPVITIVTASLSMAEKPEEALRASLLNISVISVLSGCFKKSRRLTAE
jgi:hypothetical protein